MLLKKSFPAAHWQAGHVQVGMEWLDIDAAAARAIRGWMAAHREGRDLIEIGDRRAAIAEAIALAGPDDIVMIAGKGHEQGQIVGDKVLPFDDVEVARECAA